jgi:hypothetical protein
MKNSESWDDEWFEPRSSLERAAPLLALGLALLIAWL